MDSSKQNTKKYYCTDAVIHKSKIETNTILLLTDRFSKSMQNKFCIGKHHVLKFNLHECLRLVSQSLSTRSLQQPAGIKMSTQTETIALDFPEVDHLIDKSAQTKKLKKRVSLSLEDLPKISVIPPQNYHYHHYCHRNSNASQIPLSSRKASKVSDTSSSASINHHHHHHHIYNQQQQYPHQLSSLSLQKRNSDSHSSKKCISDEEKSQEKKRKRMVYIVIGGFFFILFLCVFVVLITLTQVPDEHGVHILNHSAVANRESFARKNVRKENEELMNSLAQETSNHDSLRNLTASVPFSLK